MSATAFEGWAVVELMGHRQRPGYVQEVEIAGAKMVRIDIPTAGGDVTEFYSASAIYSIRPCAQDVARDGARRFSAPRPVRPVEYRPEEERPRIAHHDDSGFEPD